MRSDRMRLADGYRARDSEVLEIAIQLFYDKGFLSTSVRDLASALGILNGSVYHYITSKEALWRSICDSAQREICELLRWNPRCERISMEEVVGYFEQNALWHLENVRLSALLLEQSRSKGIHDGRPPLEEPVDLVLEFVRAAQHSGLVGSDVDPVLVTHFLASAYTSIPDWFDIDDSQNRIEAVAAEFASMVVTLLK